MDLGEGGEDLVVRLVVCFSAFGHDSGLEFGLCLKLRLTVWVKG